MKPGKVRSPCSPGRSGSLFLYASTGAPLQRPRAGIARVPLPVPESDGQSGAGQTVPVCMKCAVRSPAGLFPHGLAKGNDRDRRVDDDATAVTTDPVRQPEIFMDGEGGSVCPPAVRNGPASGMAGTGDERSFCRIAVVPAGFIGRNVRRYAGFVASARGRHGTENPVRATGQVSIPALVEARPLNTVIPENRRRFDPRTREGAT